MRPPFEGEAREALTYNDLKRIRSSVDYVIRENKLDVLKDSPEYVALARALMQKLV
jgi:hypothetical protein